MYRSLILCACAGLLAACSGMPYSTPMGPKATTTLEARSGSRVSGTVEFVQHGDHVMVTAKVSGLQPNQEHGFHIHDKGDCSAPDATSAGGHFNPSGKPHGPQLSDHHTGDMPALKADAQGNANVQFHLQGVSVQDGATGILGRSIVVHKDPE